MQYGNCEVLKRSFVCSSHSSLTCRNSVALLLLLLFCFQLCVSLALTAEQPKLHQFDLFWTFGDNKSYVSKCCTQ